MLLRQVALVSETSSISSAELGVVAAALQKQASRDLGPLWAVSATVDAFARLEDVPLGYWPIMVRDDINTPGAAGVHEDDAGQPFALVQSGEGWSLTASHECIEMLVDPFGRRLAAGQSPKPGQGRVQFLVEPCDPSEATEFAYIINGVSVSDFYTPKFFTTAANPHDRYSFTGAIKKPRQVLKGGYLSWHDPVTDHWFQETFFTGSKPIFNDLGKLSARTGKSFRRQIYDVTHEAFEARRPSKADISTVMAARELNVAPVGARADAWRRQVKSLTRKRAAGK
ncbi:MAG: hypothetical protein QOE33_3144 [Acidobacteriota bacterium]|nr:hypothetical protein [Acidobacteriota bacterium]